MRLLAGAGIFAALLGGCDADPYSFYDTVDIAFDFDVTPIPFLRERGAPDALSGPYVVGAPFGVWVATSRGDGHLEGWTMASSDPEVFEILSVTHDPETGLLLADVRAGSAGEAEISLIDESGDVRDTAPVEVLAPDRAVLRAAGPLFARSPLADPLEEGWRVLQGGTATFQVEYFAGDVRLSGNGALTAEAPPSQATATVETTWLFENRDWLQISTAPDATGEVPVALRVNGEPLLTVQVPVAVPDDVASVEIVGTPEDGAALGDGLVLLAQARDADGAPIYGVEYAWTRDGEAQEEAGDLYRYLFDPEIPGDVTAGYGDLVAGASIRGDGYVDSSNNVGCDVIAAGAGAAQLGPIGALLSLLSLRRFRKAGR